jgi:probable O-glycosylation ligase (exosortase A-associated)
MRDLVVFTLILSLLPFCFRRPFFGLLTFSWLAYMRPQDLCWGFARTMRFSLFVGLTMFAGYFANDAGKRPFFRRDLRSACMIGMLLLTYVSTAPAEVVDEYVISGLFEFTVIISVALFTSGQIDSKERLRRLLWVVALGLGFYGAKGGVFGLLGGRSIHQGPGGMMKDNNDFALAMVMALPMLWYLGLGEKNLLIRKFAWLVGGLTVITVILTHSRGGFLSMVLACLVIAYRSRKLFRTLAAGLVAAILFLQFAPDSVLERYATIEQAAEGEADSSVNARFRAWKIGMRMVEHSPVLGVGHKNFRHHYGRHAAVLFPGEDLFNHVAHNSYVQLWAENGTPTILLFLTLLLSTIFAMGRVRRMARERPDLDWARPYANMIEASLAGFMLGAFFLNRGHFDLSYHLVGVGAALLFLVRSEYAQGPVAVTAAAKGAGPPRLRWRPATLGPSQLPRWGRTS